MWHSLEDSTKLSLFGQSVVPRERLGWHMVKLGVAVLVYPLNLLVMPDYNGYMRYLRDGNAVEAAIGINIHSALAPRLIQKMRVNRGAMYDVVPEAAQQRHGSIRKRDSGRVIAVLGNLSLVYIRIQRFYLVEWIQLVSLHLLRTVVVDVFHQRINPLSFRLFQMDAVELGVDGALARDLALIQRVRSDGHHAKRLLDVLVQELAKG